MTVLGVAGGLLVLAAGAMHLWLYFDYFHTVHVVGILFLVNAAAALVIAVALVLTRAGWALAGGIAYSVGTLAAFLVSVYHGLFGYVERLTGTWQLAAGAAEVAALIVLLAAMAGQFPQSVARRRTYRRLRQAEPRRQQ